MQNQQILKSIAAYLSGSGQFNGLGLENLHNNYQWPFPDWPDFFTLQPPNANDFSKNIWLKENSAKLWQASDKYQCAKWIVEAWGGVRSNKPERIKHYVDTFQSGGTITDQEGVASYSKILAFMQPTEFAILDARVSAALNCIQLLDATKDPIFFLHLSTKNTKVRLFQETSKFEGWRSTSSTTIYREYNDLLTAVCSQHKNVPRYKIEMALFADAIKLIQKATNKLAPKLELSYS